MTVKQNHSSRLLLLGRIAALARSSLLLQMEQHGLSVMTVSPTKAVELIVIPFGMLTRVDPRNHVLDGVQIPTHEGAILRVKRASPGHAW